MKTSTLTIAVLAIVLLYLSGFGWIRSQCYGVTGPMASGPEILVPPDWYGSSFLDGRLAHVYWPMFYLEQRITGEDICGSYTRPPEN